MSLDFWIGLVVGCLVSFPVYQRLQQDKIRKLVKIIVTMRELHRKDWEELIYKLNHTGPVPSLTSATGLIGLILWAIGSSISQLKMLLTQKDWNTQRVITELQEIVINELQLLHTTLTKYLETLRTFLKDYQYKQEEEKKK